MDVLCTDKTGTLTQDRIVLEYSLDIHGTEDARVLRHAFLNSWFQTGLKNLLDAAIVNHADELSMYCTLYRLTPLAASGYCILKLLNAATSDVRILFSRSTL